MPAFLVRSRKVSLILKSIAYPITHPYHSPSIHIQYQMFRDRAKIGCACMLPNSIQYIILNKMLFKKNYKILIHAHVFVSKLLQLCTNFYLVSVFLPFLVPLNQHS